MHPMVLDSIMEYQQAIILVCISMVVLSTNGYSRNSEQPTTAIGQRKNKTAYMKGSVQNSFLPTTKMKNQTPAAKYLSKLTGLVKKPTMSKRVRLYHRSGYHLIMLPNGKLKGSYNARLVQKYGTFEFQSYGKSLIRMKNIATKMFVSVNSKGRVFSTANATDETLWREYLARNYFHSFTSFKYHGVGKNYNWFLAIKSSNGQIRRASRVQKKHRSNQFLVLEEK